MSYLTPLSRAMVAGVLASAEFADQRYARYNYDVIPGRRAGQRPAGLFGAWRAQVDELRGCSIARDLNANLLDGGLSIGAGAMYSRHLYGSAAETPITAIRGSASQWSFGAGLGYVF